MPQQSVYSINITDSTEPKEEYTFGNKQNL
jgi:hypothetical protein